MNAANSETRLELGPACFVWTNHVLFLAENW